MGLLDSLKAYLGGSPTPSPTPIEQLKKNKEKVAAKAKVKLPKKVSPKPTPAQESAINLSATTPPPSGALSADLPTFSQALAGAPVPEPVPEAAPVQQIPQGPVDYLASNYDADPAVPPEQPFVVPDYLLDPRYNATPEDVIREKLSNPLQQESSKRAEARPLALLKERTKYFDELKKERERIKKIPDFSFLQGALSKRAKSEPFYSSYDDAKQMGDAFEKGLAGLTDDEINFLKERLSGSGDPWKDVFAASKAMYPQYKVDERQQKTLAQQRDIHTEEQVESLTKLMGSGPAELRNALNGVSTLIPKISKYAVGPGGKLTPAFWKKEANALFGKELDRLAALYAQMRSGLTTTEQERARLEGILGWGVEDNPNIVINGIKRMKQDAEAVVQAKTAGYSPEAKRRFFSGGGISASKMGSVKIPELRKDQKKGETAEQREARKRAFINANKKKK